MLIKNNIYIVICCICFFFSSSFITVQAQEGDYTYHFSVDDGLPSNETYAVFQDSNRFIWIATDKGVSRFNGYEFKNFTTKDNLGDNTIFNFYEDGKGRIWFLSYNGTLSYFYNGKIYKPDLSLNSSQLDHHITSLYFDKNETLWIGTDREEFKAHFIAANRLHITLTKEQFSFRQIDETGYIYTGNFYVVDTAEKKELTACYIKFHNKTFFLRINIKNSNYNTTVFSPDEIQKKIKKTTYSKSWIIDKGILFFTDSKNLKRFDVTNKIYKTIELDKTLITGYDLRFILFDKELEVLDPYSKLVHYINDKLNLKNTNTHTKNNISGKLIDHQNGVWVTTLDSGIYYQPDIFIKNIPNALYHKQAIISMARDTTDLYLGSKKNGYIFKLFKDHELKTIRDTRSNPGNNNLSSFKGGVFNYNFAKKQLEYLNSNINSVHIPIKYRSVESFNANNYTFYNRLEILAIKNKKTLFSKGFKKVIRDLCYKDKNTLYIATIQGLWEQKLLDSDTSITFLGDTHPLLNTRIDAIKKDKFNRSWLATKEEGVVVIDGEKIINITTSQGLLGNICTNLYIGRTHVWVVTENGVSAINLNNIHQIDNFTKKEGLISNQVNAIHEFNNKVWVASDIGMSYFNIDYHKKKYTPDIFIKNVVVENDIRDHKELIMKPDENLIAINFQGLSYRDLNDLTYRYRLKGLDNTWHLTKSRFVQYASLAPGNYEFEVQSVNHQGMVSKESIRIQFTKENYFWKTWPFISIASLFIAILIILGFVLRLRFVRRRELLQRQAIQSKLKLLCSQMAPHFTFNAMNSIQYYIQQNDVAKASDFISDFSKLIRIVLQNSQKESITLQEELDILQIYVDIEKRRLNNCFDYTINIDKNSSFDTIRIPPMLLQPYFENAIWHGIMPKKQGRGKIEINIYNWANRTVCEIIDNGIGRKASAKYKVKTTNTSIGMALTQERLSLGNQTKKMEQTVHIEDVLDSSNTVCGTKIKLIL